MLIRTVKIKMPGLSGRAETLPDSAEIGDRSCSQFRNIIPTRPGAEKDQRKQPGRDGDGQESSRHEGEPAKGRYMRDRKLP